MVGLTRKIALQITYESMTAKTKKCLDKINNNVSKLERLKFSKWTYHKGHHTPKIYVDIYNQVKRKNIADIVVAEHHFLVLIFPKQHNLTIDRTTLPLLIKTFLITRLINSTPTRFKY